MTIRVLHVVPGVARRYGGPSEYIIGLCDSWREPGVELDVVSTDADGGGRLRVPIDRWLRGPLREWTQELLAADRLRDLGLDDAVVRATWSRFLAGEPLHHRVWSVLMACDWADRWKRSA